MVGGTGVGNERVTRGLDSVDSGVKPVSWWRFCSVGLTMLIKLSEEFLSYVTAAESRDKSTGKKSVIECRKSTSNVAGLRLAESYGRTL